MLGIASTGRRRRRCWRHRPVLAVFGLVALAVVVRAESGTNSYDWKMESVPVPEPAIDFARGTAYRPSTDFDHNPHASEARGSGTNKALMTEFDHQVIDKQLYTQQLHMHGPDLHGVIGMKDDGKAGSDEDEPSMDGPPISLKALLPPSPLFHSVPSDESTELTAAPQGRLCSK